MLGEVVAGIALRRRCSGASAGDCDVPLFGQRDPLISVIAQVGIILFMLLVGMELDTALLRKKRHAAIAISHASIVAPFVLGAAISLRLDPVLSTSDVPFSLSAMCMGVAMSITAFPVLARILTDRGIHKSRLGVIALSSAAVDDVTASCLLAFVVSMAVARPGEALRTLLLTILLHRRRMGGAATAVRPLHFAPRRYAASWTRTRWRLRSSPC